MGLTPSHVWKSSVAQTVTRPAQNQEMVRVQLTLSHLFSENPECCAKPTHSSNSSPAHRTASADICVPGPLPHTGSPGLCGGAAPCLPKGCLPSHKEGPGDTGCQPDPHLVPGLAGHRPSVWPEVLSTPCCPGLSSSQLPRAPALRCTRAHKGHSPWLSLGSKNMLSFLEFPSPPRLCGRSSHWYPTFPPKEPGKTRREQACHDTEPPGVHVSYWTTLGGWPSMHMQVTCVPERHQKLPWQARPQASGLQMK